MIQPLAMRLIASVRSIPSSVMARVRATAKAMAHTHSSGSLSSATALFKAPFRLFEFVRRSSFDLGRRRVIRQKTTANATRKGKTIHVRSCKSANSSR
ncbi:hypothetical protein C1857_14175 [Eggerthella lenta]|nr:hypothetical protein C1857_14175 [Eggerthella lenta]